MGRKSKLELDPEITERIVMFLKGGNTRRASAEAAGISEARFYDWMKRGEAEPTGEFRQFREAVTRAESEIEVMMVNSLRKAAMGFVAPKKRIKTKSYLETVKGSDGTPLVGKDGHPVQATITETEVVDFEDFEFMPTMAVEWLKRRRRADWGDSLDVRKLDDETLLRLLAGGEIKPNE